MSDQTSPPSKTALPITDSVEVYRHAPGTPPIMHRTSIVAIRSDGFVVIDGKREDIARAYLALCGAARACGQALARAELAEAFEAGLVSNDPVVRRIDEIQQAAGNTLAPETVTLMELAKEAQITGQMTDLSILKQPTDQPCSQ